MLNIIELITGHTSQLKSVVRFNNTHRNTNESVAEHSYFVALYALLIGRDVERRHGVISADGTPCIHYLTLLSRALVHDLEESRSGDFPRNFKYSDVTVLRALNAAGEHAFDDVVEPLYTEPLTDDEREIDGLRNTWKNAKDETAEGRIVALADLMSTVQFVYLETQTGNRRILRDASDVPENVRRFCREHANHKLFGETMMSDFISFTEKVYNENA